MYQVFCWWPVYIPAVLIHSRFSRPHFCWWKQTPLRDNYELAAVMCLNFREHVFPCKNQSPAPEMRTVFRKILPRLHSICDLRSQTFSTTSYMGLSQNLDPPSFPRYRKGIELRFPNKNRPSPVGKSTWHVPRSRVCLSWWRLREETADVNIRRQGDPKEIGGMSVPIDWDRLEAPCRSTQLICEKKKQPVEQKKRKEPD